MTLRGIRTCGVLSLAFIAVFSGCKTALPLHPPVAFPVDPDLRVSPAFAMRTVEVFVDESEIGTPASERLDLYGTKERLTTAVAAELASQGRLSESGEFTLHIALVRFRLRSDQLALWVGSYAGLDRLAVRVEVRRANQVDRSFETNTSTILGGIVYRNANKRLDRLIAELARRIVGGIPPAV